MVARLTERQNLLLHLNAPKAKNSSRLLGIIFAEGETVDWQRCMNQALDYIESNLSDEIDYFIAAQFVCCSVWEFRRVFSFMAQISLSEYIRRRRLTLAAADIQRGREKIIDIALRYGYECVQLGQLHLDVHSRPRSGLNIPLNFE